MLCMDLVSECAYDRYDDYPTFRYQCRTILHYVQKYRDNKLK